MPKLGGPLTPDSPGDPLVIVPPMAPTPPAEDEWSLSMASIGLVIDLSAEIIVDAMTRAHLVHTREALLSGKKPDGSGTQRKLRERTLAMPGRQSSFRGYRTGVLADGIKRTRIKGDTSKATSRIVPPSNRNVYVAQELAQGVAILTAEGKAGEVMRQAAQAAVAACLKGREVIHDDEEVEAEDA